MERTIKTNLTFQQLLDIIKQLTPEERMRINDAIWDEDMDIPAEHQALVLVRIKNAHKNPENSSVEKWSDTLKNKVPANADWKEIKGAYLKKKHGL